MHTVNLKALDNARKTDITCNNFNITRGGRVPQPHSLTVKRLFLKKEMTFFSPRPWFLGKQ